MSVENLSKSETISKFARTGVDVGSPEVQVALLTRRIKQLTGHFSKHAKDNHSKRGMLSLVERRKRLLTYLKRTDNQKYKGVLETLGLRK